MGTFAGHSRSIASGRFQGTSENDSRYAFTVIGDTLKFSDRWSTTLAYGSNVSLAQSRSAADLNVTLTPSRSRDDLVRDRQLRQRLELHLRRRLSETRRARSTTAPPRRCGLPARPIRRRPAPRPTTSLSYSRRGKRGSLRLNGYDYTDRGGTLQAQFPLLALPPGAVPPGYLDQVATFWHAGTICGAQAFDPSRVYVAEQISGATVRYRGVDASGQIVLGRAVIALPGYSVNAATLVSSDPRLLFAGSPYAVGAQLPFRPLHKASLLIDALQRKAALEWVVNGTWVSADNGFALGSYIQVAAGVTWTREGRPAHPLREQPVQQRHGPLRHPGVRPAAVPARRRCVRSGTDAAPAAHLHAALQRAFRPPALSRSRPSERVHPIEVLACGTQGTT